MKKPKSRDFLLALTAVWAVAVPKPVLDVIGKAPEYWTANRIDATMVAVFALVFTFLPPALLGGVFLALKGGDRARGVSSLFFSTAFTVLISLGIYCSSSVIFGKPIILIFCSIAIAVLFDSIYWRFNTARVFFSIYSAMALFVPITFLLFSPTRNLLYGSGTAARSIKSLVELEAPLVVVVFDELSTAHLVNSQGDVEKRLFPNFNRLAQLSTWYQNATTNYGTTEQSLPSLLTGRFQTESSSGASYKQNPQSLFSLITAPDGIIAVESVTHLCPPELCGEQSRSLWDASRQVFADFWLIYKNIVVPDRYASRIRPIPHRFRDLASVGLSDGVDVPEISDANKTVENLKEWFLEGHTKSLVFLHINLPHAPYFLNSDGTAYSKIASYAMFGWSSKQYTWNLKAPFYAVQAFQRYLVQAMFADRVLGGILDSLEETGLLRSSTLVVTADHGVAFAPGEKRRTMKLRPAVVGPNNAVPLFWKSSGQTVGTRSPRNVELIDVLPTLLEKLGDGVAASEMDGLSILSTQERDEKTFAGTPYSNDIWPEVLQTSKRRYSEVAIVENDDGSFFVQPAKYSFLVGRHFGGAKLAEHTVRLDNPLIVKELASFDVSSEFRPNFVEGWVEPETGVVVVGVAINRVIADVVDVFVDEEIGKLRFASLFNPSILKTGHNEIEFAGVQFDSSGKAVLSLLRRSDDNFFLVDRVLVNAKGVALKRAQKRLIGAFDTLSESYPGVLHIKGWIGDRKTWAAARAYLVVFRGEQQLSHPSGIRRELAASVSEDLVSSGFDTYIHFTGRPFQPDVDFQMFVIFDDDTYAEMRNEAGVMQSYEATAERVAAQPLATELHPNYYLSETGELVPAGGGALSATTHRVFTGAVRPFKVSEDSIRVAGWVAGGPKKTPALRVLFFVDGSLIHQQVPDVDRPDVAEIHGIVNRFSGFSVILSRAALRSGSAERLRVFAVFDDETFSELPVMDSLH